MVEKKNKKSKDDIFNIRVVTDYYEVRVLKATLWYGLCLELLTLECNFQQLLIFWRV